jgi:Predicted nucleotide-binding protein containing TIR-like domain
MKIGVFYSWESDRRGNRDLIQAAADEAALRISADETIKVEPALDRDTQNTSGSPAIADTILSKIQLADLFLCDVTIVSEAGEQRPTPNPNVLIELGYAVAKIGWERIICVMNEAQGGPRKLPFDLRHRRWPIRYKLSDKADADKVKQVRDKLSEEIELQIRIAIENGIIPARLNPKEEVFLRSEENSRQSAAPAGALRQKVQDETGRRTAVLTRAACPGWHRSG